MPAVCIKEFALHVGPAVSLVDYWDFDDGATPFIAKLDPDNNFVVSSGAVGAGAAGIINTCMHMSGVPLLGTASVETTANPLINPTHGFTWTTWVNFATFGGGSSIVFEIHFLNILNVEVINFRAIFPLGPPPVFPVVQKNNATFFSPTSNFSAALWYFIQIQYNATTKKFGFQRGHPVFGLGGLQESSPIADDLSAITKGYLVLKCVNDTGISPDWRQDESGFWARLLTNAEVVQLFGGGTPPAYPAIPQ